MSEKIKISFPDGNSKEFDKGITGYDIASSISKRFADEVLFLQRYADRLQQLPCLCVRCESGDYPYFSGPPFDVTRI